MEQSRIDRINELARKSKSEGLTEEEKEEQAKLRAEYIAAYKASLVSALESTYIVDEKGNKKKAEEMIDDFIERYHDLETISDNSSEILFTDYVLDWLERKKNKVQLSTWEGYEIYVKKHIIPYFEPMNLTLGEVTPKHIMDYYDSRLVCGRNDHKTGGLSIQSIKKLIYFPSFPIFLKLFQ